MLLYTIATSNCHMRVRLPYMGIYSRNVPKSVKCKKCLSHFVVPIQIKNNEFDLILLCKGKNTIYATLGRSCVDLTLCLHMPTVTETIQRVT